MQERKESLQALQELAGVGSSMPSKPSILTPGAPPRDLPFEWSVETLRGGLNFTLTTSVGDIDLLGEITGGGSCADLEDHAIEVRLFAQECLCLSLAELIRVKRAAGRPRDLEAVAEVEAIREERGEQVP